MYAFLADLVLVLHSSFVFFVLFGQISILIGIWRHWHWVYHFWFRWIHFSLVLIVAAESWLGWVCPLTTWESELRKMAGQAAYKQSFIADWLSQLIFFEAPSWVFTLIYSLFFILVLGTFLIWPPRRKNKP